MNNISDIHIQNVLKEFEKNLQIKLLQLKHILIEMNQISYVFLQVQLQNNQKKVSNIDNTLTVQKQCLNEVLIQIN